MPRYHDYDGDDVCDECGVWVQDTGLHSAYHDRLEQIAAEVPRGATTVYGGSRGAAGGGGGGGGAGFFGGGRGGDGGNASVLGDAAAQLRWADHGKTLERERIQRLAADVRAHYHDPDTGESRPFAELLGGGQ